jgi:folate-binding protein YgfZ
MPARPDIVLCTRLPDRSVLRVGGEEARDFLQAILTQDIASIEPGDVRLAALCSAKGRTLGLFRVVAHRDGFDLLMPRELCPAIEKRLNLYVLRRDVRIERLDDIVCAGLMWSGGPADARPGSADPEIDATIATLAGDRTESDRGPSLVDAAGRLCLREDRSGATRRLSIYGPEEIVTQWLAGIDGEPTGSDAWVRAEIEERLPEIVPATSEHFVPQWINLDDLDAFSLRKGCYPGQEVIARMHYLGHPNRRLFAAQAPGLAPPAPGTPIETETGETAGEVVRSAPLPDGAGASLLGVIKLKHLHTPLRIDGLTLSLDPHDILEGAGEVAGAPH